MAWHLLEKVIEHSASHSTLLGKWWIAIMFVFRIIVVASIGDTVYSDEQDEFVCNTRQPGCKQVCYNMFAPVSHIRFWAFQILATGTPSVIFIIFAMHKLALLPSKPDGPEAQKEAGTQTSWRYASSHANKRRFDDRKSESKHSRSSNNSKHSTQNNVDVFYDHDTRDGDSSSAPPRYEKVCREKKVKNAKQMILKGYVLQVLFRTLMEGGFIYMQYLLYKWTVPETFECIRYPCPKIVECYISRPMEKTIFLYFMFIVGAVCFVINIFELKYLGWRRMRRALASKPPPFVPPSSVLGTYPAIEAPNRSNYDQPLGRVIHRNAASAPPGYYIPDVDPPSEKYRSPANGFPHIRMRAASFTTSESDVTTDDDVTSVDSGMHVLRENVRSHL